MDLGFWRDISVVLLVLEALILNLIPLAIVYFLGRGMLYVLRELRGVFAKIRDILNQVQEVVTEVTDRIVAPFIAVGQFFARLRGIALGIRRQLGLNN